MQNTYAEVRTLAICFAKPARQSHEAGIARVSTGDQNLDGQCQRLSAAGCEKLFEEKISGARRNRPKLEKLIEQLRKGDVLVVTRLDRLARSTSELLRIAERLTAKSAGLQSLDEPWADTTSPSGRMVMTIFAGIAEFERTLIISRKRWPASSLQRFASDKWTSCPLVA